MAAVHSGGLSTVPSMGGRAKRAIIRASPEHCLALERPYQSQSVRWRPLKRFWQLSSSTLPEFGPATTSAFLGRHPLGPGVERIHQHPERGHWGATTCEDKSRAVPKVIRSGV